MGTPIRIKRQMKGNERGGGGGNFGRTPTAQEKLINVGNKFGNKGLKRMQGTSYLIYDHLPLPEGGVTVNTTLRFFENSSARQFPFTNLREGRLPVGNGMVYERCWFNMLTIEDSTGYVVNIQTFSEFGLPALYKIDFTFENDTQKVIKDSSLVKQKSQYNWQAWHAVNEVIHMDTDVTIQPLIDFVLIARLPGLATPVSSTLSFYVGCYIEGAGALLNPRANY